MSVRALSDQANLKQHLLHHQRKGDVIKIGSMNQLRSIVKIKRSDAVAFAMRGETCKYPKLPKRNYLIACVDTGCDVEVWGVYTYEQMITLNGGNVYWGVLEIPIEIECFLSKEIKGQSNNCCAIV